MKTRHRPKLIPFQVNATSKPSNRQLEQPKNLITTTLVPHCRGPNDQLRQRLDKVECNKWFTHTD